MGVITVKVLMAMVTLAVTVTVTIMVTVTVTVTMTVRWHRFIMPHRQLPMQHPPICKRFNAGPYHRRMLILLGLDYSTGQGATE